MNLKKGTIRLIVYFIVCAALVFAKIFYSYLYIIYDIPEYLDSVIKKILLLLGAIWILPLGMWFVVKGCADDKNVSPASLIRSQKIMFITSFVLGLPYGWTMLGIAGASFRWFGLWALVWTCTSIWMYRELKKKYL